MGFQTAFFGDFLSLVKESYPSETIPALLLGHPVRGQPLRRFAPPPLTQGRLWGAARSEPHLPLHKGALGDYLSAPAGHLPLQRGGKGGKGKKKIVWVVGGEGRGLPRTVRGYARKGAIC